MRDHVEKVCLPPSFLGKPCERCPEQKRKGFRVAELALQRYSSLIRTDSLTWDG